jgi:hypothetical protein
MFLLSAFNAAKINIMGITGSKPNKIGLPEAVSGELSMRPKKPNALFSIVVRGNLTFPACFTKGSRLRDQAPTD